MINPNPCTLLRVKRDGPHGLFGKAAIIATDEEAEALIGKDTCELDYYRAFRQSEHEVQESLMLADRKWFSEVAEPELKRLLNKLSSKRGVR